MQYSTDTIDHLNQLLRDEMLACQSYERALKKIENAKCKEILSDCLISHLQRADKLKDEVTNGGGTPDENSGASRAFAQFIAQSASLLGNDAAISALEEREETIMRDYEAALQQSCGPVTHIIETVLLPEQERTHAALLNAHTMKEMRRAS